MQNEQLGQVVADTMINRLENKTIETRVIDLGYEIIERDSACYRSSSCNVRPDLNQNNANDKQAGQCFLGKNQPQ